MATCTARPVEQAGGVRPARPATRRSDHLRSDLVQLAVALLTGASQRLKRQFCVQLVTAHHNPYRGAGRSVALQGLAQLSNGGLAASTARSRSWLI